MPDLIRNPTASLAVFSVMRKTHYFTGRDQSNEKIPEAHTGRDQSNEKIPEAHRQGSV